jgi:hypothetical protein
MREYLRLIRVSILGIGGVAATDLTKTNHPQSEPKGIEEAKQ